MAIVAACGPGSASPGPATTDPQPAPATAGPSTPPATQEVIGEPEGELNMVIWPGYAERGAVDPAYNWVTPFETKTGCKVNTTDRTTPTRASSSSSGQ